MNAIILCGGLGTRLGELTKSTPKPLINVSGRPFLFYILDQLVNSKIDSIILSVGFEWNKIKDCVGDNWHGIQIKYSIESSPLGTGGAIKEAMYSFNLDESLVINGDSYFDINIQYFLNFSKNLNSNICIAVKQLDDCNRYGKIEISDDGLISSFGEKNSSGSGLINGGIYYLKRVTFKNINLTSFSFESDLLAPAVSNNKIYAIKFDSYFIDIGIPSDLFRAQSEFKLR